MCDEAEDAGGLAPAKDDNEAARHFIRRTLPVLNCVDYKGKGEFRGLRAATEGFALWTPTAFRKGRRNF